MKALFYTTKTTDAANHVYAWNSISAVPAVHIAYNHRGINNDWQMLDAAREGVDVIFYIGAHRAPGNPHPQTFIEARKLAPIINFCCDATDPPWHPVLLKYKEMGCFDLQVAIDGGRDAPVDLSVLTPVNTTAFHRVEKDIRCGFSGSVKRFHDRFEVIEAIGDMVTIRNRLPLDGPYQEHADFLSRCRMTLNESTTGSGKTHHIKGRVLESGWAGCALLESIGSPILDWFHPGSVFLYRTAEEAVDIIRSLTDAEIDTAAKHLADQVRAKYTPEMIYGKILSYVHLTLEKPAA